MCKEKKNKSTIEVISGELNKKSPTMSDEGFKIRVYYFYSKDSSFNNVYVNKSVQTNDKLIIIIVL
jgi:hypothetical protein